MLQSNIVEQNVTKANFQGKLADLRAGELRSAFGISNRVNYSLFEPDPLYIATEKAEGETEVRRGLRRDPLPGIRRASSSSSARVSRTSRPATGRFDAKSYKALFNWVAIGLRGASAAAGSAPNRVPNVAELYAARRARCSAGAQRATRA